MRQRMIVKTRYLLPLLLLGVACSPGDPLPEVGEDGAADLLSEHHAHLESASAHTLLLEIAAFVGQELGDDAGRPGGRTADDLVAVMDSVGVARAQVLSVAYFYGFPDFPVEGRTEGMRLENDYVAQQVARYPERLVGACSVNPLSDDALGEVSRCADDARLVGLKLHFANSDVDLRDTEDVRRVAAVFRQAGERGLPIVAHIRTRAPDYGAGDVEIFIRDILAQAPQLPVQIAHMAGWGGYDANTREALDRFIQAFADGELDPAPYTFDLAAVVVPPEMAEGDTALARELEAANRDLAERIRQLGTDRVLFASDWAAVPMGGTLEALRTSLPLSPGELADILDNVGPLLR